MSAASRDTAGQITVTRGFVRSFYKWLTDVHQKGGHL
jgi:hypothetical protein